MLYEDIRSEIQTGDVFGYHGTKWTSRIIEFFKGSNSGIKDPDPWSHVGLFYWSGDGLWIAQEYEGTGFGCYPASQLITSFLAAKGKCYWGKAPYEISSKPQDIIDLISTYRVTPSLQPYGYGTLIRILLGERGNPNDFQAVCSTFDQQAWEKCGYTFNRLFAPEDFKSVVNRITSIE